MADAGGSRRPPQRILVLTLSSGEPQLDACTDTIAKQSGVDVRHRVIAGLDNVSAHRALYSTIEELADDFDLFIKVDADMVLRDEDVLSQIRAEFEARPSLDHAVYGVDDFYTGRPIFGLHAFSHRARWPDPLDGLFVDPAPAVPGNSVIVEGPPSPVAFHAPDPSREQAWSFGVHRAMKVVQPATRPFRGGQALEQWQILLDVAANYRRTRDPRLALALRGAAEALRKSHGLVEVVYLSSEVQAWRDDLSEWGGLHTRVMHDWSAIRRVLLRARAIGFAAELRLLAIRATRLRRRSRW